MSAQSIKVDQEFLRGFIREADKSIPQLNWADRDSMLLNYLQFLEYFFLVEIPKFVTVHGQDTEDAIHDQTRSGAKHIIRWIHTQAAQQQVKPVKASAITADQIKQFWDIQSFAVKYSELRDWENVAYEKFYAVEAITQSHVRAYYQDEDRKRGQAAEWLLKGLQKIATPCQFDPTPLLRDVFANTEAPDKFNVPIDHVQDLINTPNPHFEALWRMDPATSFGDFTLAEFRTFWSALYCLSDIQTNVARIIASRSDFPFTKVLLRMDQPGWLDNLHELTSLDQAKLSLLLDLMLYNEAQAEADSGWQPLFKFHDGTIAMSNFLVRNSNAETNLFALWNSMHGAKYGPIAGKKESWWVKQKRPELEKQGYITRGPVVFSSKAGQPDGDIDLFVFHPKSKTALCCQLKWFLVPDRFRESNVDKVLGGVKQVKDAVTWLATDTDRAQSSLSIKKALYKDVLLLPLIISRDWMLNGIKWDDDVPVISEPLFDFLLDSAPADDPLLAVWECARQRTYLPTVQVDFTAKQRTIQLACTRLDYERLEAAPGVQWSKKRIKFPELKKRDGETA